MLEETGYFIGSIEWDKGRNGNSRELKGTEHAITQKSKQWIESST
jgi:hypothetical protein